MMPTLPMSKSPVNEISYLSQKCLLTTVELAHAGISHLSLEGKFLWANPYYCNFLGYTNEELLNVSVNEVTHPDDRAMHDSLISKLISGELKTFNMDKRFIRKDGTTVWGNVRASIVRDLGGPRYIVSVTRDISDIKVAES